MASSSSTPPAPAPTTPIRIGASADRTRARSRVHRSTKRPMGLTGITASAAPGTPWNAGVEPTLIDTMS